MKRTLLLLSLLAITKTYSQTHAFKAFDLDPGTGDSSPGRFISFNGKMIFTASTTATGSELWISDGTAAGTKMVKDIYPGSQGSYPSGFMEMNGKLYFIAMDNANDYELWVTNGTSTGTGKVKDIRPVLGGVVDLPKIVFNNKLYFIGNDGTTGKELWVTDGTAAGTHIVKDIAPGIQASHTPFSTSSFIVYNGRIFFTASTANEEVELWVTDGTEAGTQLVKDIWPGTTGSRPTFQTVFNNKLYFIASTQSNGQELWESDGTTAGTKEVMDLYPGSFAGVASIIVSTSNNKLYLHGGDATTGYELYTTDGTASGTSLVKDIRTGNASSSLLFIKEHNGIMYFVADDGVSGSELWKTDGTSAGTSIVKDIIPGSVASTPKEFAVYKNALYFTAQQATGDYQLFRTDGSSAGTQVITNAQSTKTNPLAYTGELYVYDSLLFFAADYNSIGFELWTMKEDSGTVINHLNSGIDNFSVSPNPNNGNFVLTVNSGYDFEDGFVNIYDLSGRLVYSQPVQKNEENIPVSLTNVSKGVYIVELKQGEGSGIHRVIVK